MKKVLVTDYVHDHLLEGLKNLGYLVDYNQDCDLETTRRVISDYEGIVINSKTIMDRSMIETGRKLKFIGRLGSGLEIIDLHAAKENDVHVFNAPGGNSNAVGEHALGMLLAFANNLMRSDQQVRQKVWKREENRGFELEGKTIGIIGFGNAGSAFAKVLSGFDLTIMAYDKYKVDYTDGFENAQISTLEQILNESDIISLHLPLTQETENLVDMSFLSQMKAGSMLINTSRGKIVDLDSLIKNLNSGHLIGACLDVFPNEKPGSFTDYEKKLYDRLYACSNTILTPHIAGWTNESLYKIADILLQKIKNMS